MFVVTKAGGQCMAMPDVCKTPAPPAPPVPIPYPNIGMPPMGAPATTTVLIAGAPALNTSSEIPMTSGDEAGVAGGAMSGTVMGKVQFVTGSMTVMLEGAPAVRLGDPTQQNGGNMVGAVLAPSQPVVMVLS